MRPVTTTLIVSAVLTGILSLFSAVPQSMTTEGLYENLGDLSVGSVRLTRYESIFGRLGNPVIVADVALTEAAQSLDAHREATVVAEALIKSMPETLQSAAVEVHLKVPQTDATTAREFKSSPQEWQKLIHKEDLEKAAEAIQGP